MKKECLILALIILNLATLNLDGYCANGEDVDTAVTETTIEAILEAGFKSSEESDFSAAIQKFEQVIARDAENSLAYYGLGFVYLTQGDAVKAKDYFIKCVMIDATSDPAYRGLGDCYRQLGDREKAEEYYMKAIAINGENQRAQFSLGTLYSEDKNKEGALKQAEILATLDLGLEGKLREQILADNPVDPI